MKLRLAVAFFVATTSYAALDDSLSKLTAVSREGEGNEPAEMETPLDVMVDTERLDRAWKAFEKLGADCQKLLRMAMADRTPEEISAELGYTNEGTIRVKKHKCKDKWIELYRATDDQHPGTP